MLVCFSDFEQKEKNIIYENKFEFIIKITSAFFFKNHLVIYYFNMKANVSSGTCIYIDII